MKSVKAPKAKQKESPANQQAGSIFFDRYALWFMRKYGYKFLKNQKRRTAVLRCDAGGSHRHHRQDKDRAESSDRN
jgi:hypothetical protein